MSAFFSRGGEHDAFLFVSVDPEAFTFEIVILNFAEAVASVSWTRSFVLASGEELCRVYNNNNVNRPGILC
jgi:hypothetical protein